MMEREEMYIRFSPVRFLFETACMSLEERGVYITLLSLMHQRGHLEKDYIEGRFGKLSPEVFAHFYTDGEGKIGNEYIEREIKAFQAFSEKQACASAKRWSVCNPTGIPRESHGNPTGIPARIERDNKHTVLPDGFVEFWSAYPKKVNKERAIAAWTKLNPDKALIETILSAVENQKQNDESWRREKGRYIPHPTTWLNGKMWENKLEVDMPVASGNPFLDMLREDGINDIFGD